MGLRSWRRLDKKMKYKRGLLCFGVTQSIIHPKVKAGKKKIERKHLSIVPKVGESQKTFVLLC